MNIFWLDNDPATNAQYHGDQHIIKMIIESAQMLSVALRENGRDDDFLTGSSHVNHPCTKWVRESRENYTRLYDLATALYDEKLERFGGGHKSYEERIALMPREPDCIGSHGPTERPLCMPDQFHSDDVVLAYRAYYGAKMGQGKVRYNHSEEPPWLSSKL